MYTTLVRSAMVHTTLVRSAMVPCMYTTLNCNLYFLPIHITLMSQCDMHIVATVII